MSPASNRSGSSTPIHPAPRVPSMLPIAQKPVLKHSTPMNSLDAMRNLKTLRPGNPAPEMKALEMQWKAQQMEIAKLMANDKERENRLEQVKTLAAEVAALKQQLAAKSPTSEDTERRLCDLENAKPVVEAQGFAQLQSDVQNIRIDLDKQLSAAAQTIKDGIDKDLSHAVTKDEIETMIQIAIQSEFKKFQREQETSFDDLSTKLAANKNSCDDLNKHNLPAQLQRLKTEIDRVDSNEKKAYKELTSLNRQVYGHARLPGRTLSDAKETVIQRILSLEDESRSARKHQDHLHTEHKALSECVEKLAATPHISASPTPLLIHNRIEEVASDLDARVSDLDEAVKRVLGEQKSQESKGSNSQESLQSGYKTALEHIENCSEQIEQLQTRMKTLSSQQDVLQQGQIKPAEHKDVIKRLNSLESWMKESEKHVSHVKQLASEQANARDAFTKLETTVMALGHTGSVNHLADASSPANSNDILSRLLMLEVRVAGENGLETTIKDVEDHFEAMDEELHNLKNSVKVILDKFTAVFKEQFDPFKTSVEEQLEKSRRQLSELPNTFQEYVEKPRGPPPAPAFSDPQLLWVEDMVQKTVQATVQVEMEQYDTALESLKQQMIGKQDVTSGTQAINAVKAAVRSLQFQYDNISTEDLHKKMVHWFLQQYPSNAANLLPQLEAMKHDIAQMKDFTELFTRTPNGAQKLVTLVQNEPNIIALVQSPRGSGELVEAVEAFGKASPEAYARHQSLAETVSTLQRTMQKFESDKAPFVRAASLKAMEQALRTDFEAGLKEEHDARTKYETKAKEEEYHQRKHVETSIETEIKSRIDQLKTGEIKAIYEQLGGIHAILKMHSYVTDPVIKESIGRLHILHMHVGQMQWVLDTLARNLPKGNLEFKWTCDLKTIYNVPDPFPEGTNPLALPKK